MRNLFYIYNAFSDMYDNPISEVILINDKVEEEGLRRSTYRVTV